MDFCDIATPMASELDFLLKNRCHLLHLRKVTAKGVCVWQRYSSPSVFNMSDKKDVPTSDEDKDVTIDSEYATPENLSFKNATLLDACCTPIKTNVLERTLQQEAEEYSTPSFEFLQWRCVDRHATPVTPELSHILDETRDVDTPRISACDTSLLAHMSKLCLFTPRNICAPASTPTKMDPILMNLECTPEKNLAQISHTVHSEHRGLEMNAKEPVLDRDHEMRDEFTDEDVTSSDYSTMLDWMVDRDSSSMMDKDSSTKLIYDDSSNDHLSSRDTQSDATQETVIPSGFAEAETKKLRNLVNTESTDLLDNSTATLLYGQPSTSRDKVYETDTFDTFNVQYNQNVAFTRRYVEEMVMKEQDSPSGCFRCFWSPRRIIRTSPCRLFRESKRIKERNLEDCGSVKTTSSESIGTVETSSDREWEDPSLKLRLGRIRGTREVQIPERTKSGNAFHLDGRETADR